MRTIVVCLSIFFLLMEGAWGVPYTGYSYPAGMKKGTSCRVIIGGQELRGIRKIHIDNPGIKLISVVRVPNFTPNIPKSQREYLSRWFENINKGDKSVPARDPEVADFELWKANEWWDKLNELNDMEFRIVETEFYSPKKNPLESSPSIAQRIIIDLEAEESVPSGCYEFRLEGQTGVSAPRKFYIDDASHVEERGMLPPYGQNTEYPLVSGFPRILDGQIMPGETDIFRVILEKGKTYSFDLKGYELQPYIGDAVPGHFQPVMTLTDDKGKEVAFADDAGADPDPRMVVTPVESGEYVLMIRDNLYRGRSDFVYRVEAREGGADPTPRPSPFAEGTKEVPAERYASQALDVTELPVVVVGTVAKAGGKSQLRIKAKAGQRLTLDVAAARCGSALDSVLTVKTEKGAILAENDDVLSVCNVGLSMRNTDSCLSVEFPKTATYLVEITDRCGGGGKEYGYRMNIREQKPQFRGYTGVSTLSMGNAPVPLKFYVERLEGFTGDVFLFSEDVEFKGEACIPTGKTEISCPVFAKKKGKSNLMKIKFTASASAEKIVASESGKGVDSLAVIPADEYMQAFAYTHLMPTQDFYLFFQNPRKPGAGKKGKNESKGTSSQNQSTSSTKKPL